LILEISLLIIGTLLGCMISMLPGLHVYNVVGFFLLIYFAVQFVEPLAMIMLLIGMLVGYAFMFTIPSIYFSAPDDSTVFVLMPSQRMMKEGNGYQAVKYIGMGALIGVGFIVIALPILSGILPIIWNVFSPYLHIVIGAVIVYMLMSEFPKGGEGGEKRLRRGWKNILAGYLTFALAGLLGIVIFNHTLIPLDRAFQSLMAPLIGFFAIPSLIINLVAKFDVPEQKFDEKIKINKYEATHGAIGGILGGFFAALIPAVTAGVGGYLASHATAQRGDKAFLISQGASRVVYYVGAIALFFIPTMHLRRGTLAATINLFYTPRTPQEFYLVLGGIALSGVISFLLLLTAAKFIGRRIHRINQKYLSFGILVFLTVLVGIMTGIVGVFIMYVAAMIGLIPILYNSRRSHCLAVILVPIFLNMAGIYVPI